MNTQPTLFDLSQMARSTDPFTSRVAAREHVESGKCDSYRAYILALVRKHPGLTSLEYDALCAHPDITRTEVSRRLPDLEKKGFVRKGPVKKYQKKPMVTWWPNESSEHRAEAR